MTSSTGIPALDRLIRTVLQFIVSGGLTAIVNAVAGGLSPIWSAIVLGGLQLLVTAAQNILEDMNKIPTILKGSSEAEYAQQLGLKRTA